MGGIRSDGLPECWDGTAHTSFPCWMRGGRARPLTHSLTATHRNATHCRCPSYMMSGPELELKPSCLPSFIRDLMLSGSMACTSLGTGCAPLPATHVCARRGARLRSSSPIALLSTEKAERTESQCMSIPPPDATS